MIRFAPLILGAAPAWADSVSINGTDVTLQDSDRPGAVAELVMWNANVNGPSDDGHYHLNHEGLSVSVEFIWTNGSDSILVTVPPDFIAVPQILTVEEGQAGVVHIFSVHDTGM